MTRDLASENITSYRGDRAIEEWSADVGLYPSEQTIVARHFPPAPARVLDLGCGAGRTTVGLEELGYRVEAIDLSEDLVTEARRRVVASRVQLMDARDLQFDDASFDAVLFSFNGLDCLHPSAARRAVIGEVKRVLRRGGTFYYSGHNGLAMLMPRAGDSFAQTLRRNQVLLRAQRRAFAERARYLAYPDQHGSQVLHSALAPVHLRELDQLGFEVTGIYGSRAYRNGPHLLDNAAPAGGWRATTLLRLASLMLTCPHVHYVSTKR